MDGPTERVPESARNLWRVKWLSWGGDPPYIRRVIHIYIYICSVLFLAL